MIFKLLDQCGLTNCVKKFCACVHETSCLYVTFPHIDYIMRASSLSHLCSKNTRIHKNASIIVLYLEFKCHFYSKEFLAYIK